MKELEKRDKQKEVLNSIRKSLGSESLTLAFRCSTTGKGFTIVLERRLANQKYTVMNIVKQSEISSTSSLPPISKSRKVNIDEVDCTNIKCPYCAGGSWTLIQCHCGGLSCAGGIEEQNSLHICPWCGNKGYVSGDIVNVTGNSKRGLQIGKTQETSRLTHPQTKHLLDR